MDFDNFSIVKIFLDSLSLGVLLEMKIYILVIKYYFFYEVIINHLLYQIEVFYVEDEFIFVINYWIMFYLDFVWNVIHNNYYNENVENFILFLIYNDWEDDFEQIRNLNLVYLVNHVCFWVIFINLYFDWIYVFLWNVYWDFLDHLNVLV